MITWVAPIIAAILAGLGVELVNRKKNKSETELNEVHQAEITAKMALDFAEEKDAFYRIRLHLLEEENRELKGRINCLEKTQDDLKAEILEMRKRLS